MRVVNIQKSKDQFWVDETGTKIPYNRTTKVERLMERKSGQLYKHADTLNKKLLEFKTEVAEVCQEVYDAYMEACNNKKPSKGNYTWYNFDRSIKIEINVNTPIKFDELGIAACKDKLDEFFETEIETKNAFIKEIITDAFETSRGNLDTKKVMDLFKHRKRVNKPLFDEALDLLEKSIRRPASKTYFRIWAKNTEGKYENVDLNFSSVK